VSAPEGANWRPERPCREEVENCIRFLRDSLTAQGLAFEFEQIDENPDCWFVMASDADGYENAGFVGWYEEEGRVSYACFDAPRLHHDLAEGFTEDESRCFLQPESAMVMLLFLNGKVRKVAALMRAEALLEQRAEEERERRDAA
jgi:hypothetical protein